MKPVASCQLPVPVVSKRGSAMTYVTCSHAPRFLALELRIRIPSSFRHFDCTDALSGQNDKRN